MPAIDDAERLRFHRATFVTSFKRVARDLVLNVGYIVKGRKGKRGKSTTKGKGSSGGGIRTMRQRIEKRAAMLRWLIVGKAKSPTPLRPSRAPRGQPPPSKNQP